MRSSGLFFCLSLALTSFGQPPLVINELQAANRRTFVTGSGATPDWIEVYNSGSSVADMEGMRLVVAGRQHQMDGGLLIPPGDPVLLWFDGHPERGPDHIGFRLPRKGGTLLLVDADGHTILDVFTYPAMAGDLSVGRMANGSREWTYFTTPTPGMANHGSVMIQSRAAAPYLDPTLASATVQRTIGLSCAACDTVRFTLDGTEPSRNHGSIYHGPIMLEDDAVLRAKAFKHDQLDSKELCMTLIDGSEPMDGITLAMDQRGLTDDSTGINTEGALANFSRRGRPWERLAMVQFNASNEAPVPVGISIHGSGSRGLPKRSFKLHARDRYDSPVRGIRLDAEHFTHEGILRADAGPHTFLRNLFIEHTITRYAMNVEVQASQPTPLYLNGQYWGLYRWMPPKDEKWLRSINGGGSFDVLEGSAGTVRSGSDKHFKRALETLLAAGPVDSIDAVIDTGSLIDLACIDLFTGRADHELNVRCYRPREATGRWRWVVYDMDLWSPANENSIQRMGLSSGPEPPYLPVILAHDQLRIRFLSRLTALLATAFDPNASRALSASLYLQHELALEADHERWQHELKRPDPAECAREMDLFLAERPSLLVRHVSAETGYKLHEVSVDVPAPESAVVTLNGLQLRPGEQVLFYFEGVPALLEVTPSEGWSFMGWKGRKGDAGTTVIDLSEHRRIAPLLVRDLP